MHSAIDHRGRGAGAKQFVEKELGPACAMRGIGEFLLLDKSIVLQPVEELRPVGADDLGLRIVDVRVDEAGHDE